MGSYVLRRADRGVGEVGKYGVTPAGSYDRKLKARYGANQRCVEGLSSKAIPNEPDAEGFVRLCHVLLKSSC
jgi:hypothetical protein